jgi:S-adenosyl methyltransferase
MHVPEDEGEGVSLDTSVPHIARVYDYLLGGLPPARRGLRVSAGRGPDVVVLVTTRREKRWREPSSPAAGRGQGGWRGHHQRL